MKKCFATWYVKSVITGRKNGLQRCAGKITFLMSVRIIFKRECWRLWRVNLMWAFTHQDLRLSWCPEHAGSITSEVRYLHRTGNGYGNKRPEQQGGNARSAVENSPDDLWSAMKSGITMMTGSVSPSPGSSRYALHARKSNTWGSASSGVKRTKRWLILLFFTGGTCCERRFIADGYFNTPHYQIVIIVTIWH